MASRPALESNRYRHQSSSPKKSADAVTRAQGPKSNILNRTNSVVPLSNRERQALEQVVVIKPSHPHPHPPSPPPPSSKMSNTSRSTPTATWYPNSAQKSLACGPEKPQVTTFDGSNTLTRTLYQRTRSPSKFVPTTRRTRTSGTVTASAAPAATTHFVGSKPRRQRCGCRSGGRSARPAGTIRWSTRILTREAARARSHGSAFRARCSSWRCAA